MRKDFLTAFQRSTDTDLTDELFDLPDLPNAGNALAVQGDGTIQLGNYTLTPIGLQIGNNATHEEWQQLGQILRRLDGSLQWLIGDWLVQGEMVWGESYEAIAQATGYDPKTLYQFKWVASNIQFSLRRENLTFGHHKLVVGLQPIQQQHWLIKADDAGWSISQLRAAMKPKADSPTLDIVTRYQQKLREMRRELKVVGRGERAQVAILLRQLADAIDGLGDQVQ